jgi:hypothetical protein
VTVVSWNTGWADEHWERRVEKGFFFAERCGFAHQTLTARASFDQLVLDRGEFPTAKFQWCATLLKGVPLLQWLNQVDPDRKAQIIMPARRSAKPVYAQLTERIEECEHYGGRDVWHPLLEMSNEARDALILEAGFSVLSHRSLECDPCIHSGREDFARLSANSCVKTDQLEKKIGKVMFPIPVIGQASALASDIGSHVARARRNGMMEDNLLPTPQGGCGAPYGCGI